MPSHKKALPSTGSHYNEAIAPEPPEDLWEQMAAILTPARPANAFTSEDFATRFKCGSSTARKKLRELVKAGLVEAHGPCNTQRYYVWKGRKG